MYCMSVLQCDKSEVIQKCCPSLAKSSSPPAPLCGSEWGNILKQKASGNNLDAKCDIIFLFELLNRSAASVSCIAVASPSAEGLWVCECAHTCRGITCHFY